MLNIFPTFANFTPHKKNYGNKKFEYDENNNMLQTRQFQCTHAFMVRKNSATCIVKLLTNPSPHRNIKPKAGFTSECESERRMRKRDRTTIHLYTSVHWAASPEAAKWTLHKRIECEFPFKYRLLMDSVRLFTECSSHSRMLFVTRLH